MNPFEYLYFQFYAFGTKIGNQDEPNIKAMYLFLITQTLNFLTLIFWLTSSKVIPKLIEPGLVFIPIGILLWILNYYFLARRYKKIIGKFQSDISWKKMCGFVILLLYVAISVVLLCIALPREVS